jgi:hypothetical protein
MKAENIINMIKRFIKQYGVDIKWNEQEMQKNSRGRATASNTEIIKSAKVLLLKEKFNPLQVINTDAIGLGQDYTRYLLAFPEVGIKKDTVITDNHNMKWKLGIVDWFDVGGVPVAKQSALIEVA